MLTRIIVCGGRNADIDPDIVDTFISNIINGLDRNEIEIVSGTARGGDQLGEQFAERHNMKVVRFKPEWNVFGKRAGYVRNHKMVYYISKCENPIVVAIWDGSSKGTKDTINTAKSQNIPVYVLPY